MHPKAAIKKAENVSQIKLEQNTSNITKTNYSNKTKTSPLKPLQKHICWENTKTTVLHWNTSRFGPICITVRERRVGLGKGEGEEVAHRPPHCKPKCGRNRKQKRCLASGCERVLRCLDCLTWNTNGWWALIWCLSGSKALMATASSPILFPLPIQNRMMCNDLVKLDRFGCEDWSRRQRIPVSNTNDYTIIW